MPIHAAYRKHCFYLLKIRPRAQTRAQLTTDLRSGSTKVASLIRKAVKHICLAGDGEKVSKSGQFVANVAEMQRRSSTIFRRVRCRSSEMPGPGTAVLPGVAAHCCNWTYGLPPFLENSSPYSWLIPIALGKILLLVHAPSGVAAGIDGLRMPFPVTSL